MGGISLETFRAFAADAAIGDRASVAVGDEGKTTLSTSRLNAREITKQEIAADNFYVRGQLLSAVRDALGEANGYFQKLQKELLPVSSKTGQIDVKAACKELKARDIRAVLNGMAAAKNLKKDFEERITQDFTQIRGGRISARNLELVRGILNKEFELQMATCPRLNLEKLTGRGSLYEILRSHCRQRLSNRIFVNAFALPARQVKPYLKACESLHPQINNEDDVESDSSANFANRLFVLADRLENLTDFSPYKLFKLCYPELKWPTELSKGLTKLNLQNYQTLSDSLSATVMNMAKGNGAMAQDRDSNFDMEVRSEFCCPGLLDIGLSVPEVVSLVQGEKQLGVDLFSPCVMLSGSGNMEKDDVKEAFDQVVLDLPRLQPTVHIKQPNSEELWTMSPAATIVGHKCEKSAQNELRERVENLCGKNASETMKANIFLFMSQAGLNGEQLFTSLNGLQNSDVASGYTFYLSAEKDGSVVVSRTIGQSPHYYAIDVTIRFRPDGSQELVGKPELKFDSEMTADKLAEERARMIANAKERADKNVVKAYFDASVEGCFAQKLADLKDWVSEAELSDVKMVLRNTFEEVVSGDKDFCARFAAADEPAQARMFFEVVNNYKKMAELKMTAKAIEFKLMHDAEHEIMQEVGNMGFSFDEDITVNVDKMRLKLQSDTADYFEELRGQKQKVDWEHMPDNVLQRMEDDVLQRMTDVKNKYVANRKAVLEFLKLHEDIGFCKPDLKKFPLIPRLRTRLVKKAVGQGVTEVTLDDLKNGLEFGLDLNLPPSDWWYDNKTFMDVCDLVVDYFNTRKSQQEVSDEASTIGIMLDTVFAFQVWESLNLVNGIDDRINSDDVRNWMQEKIEPGQEYINAVLINHLREYAVAVERND